MATRETIVPGSAAVEAKVDWRVRHHSTLRALRLYVHTFSRSLSSMIGFALVALFFLLVVIGPWVVPYPEDATGVVNLDIKLQAPSADHWFGTDEVGNDIFTRVVLGTRVSFQIGLIVVAIAMVIGVPLGIVAGFAGGWLRELIMRTTDVFLS
ncbi:MAG: hypothetical protein MI920_35735, partial [Kiloniellales bacterium]|nr:hypothetical protein [Kiloniellales bacterium]